MVRSMFSGVSGLRTHQTRMDTIGNNIANVNTYGYKSARTTFRDMYYQTMFSASEPTAASGGQNVSSVGYGSKVGSVDLMMSQSSFTMTDQTMDLAVDGEGFFQVQDAAGNIYYTRAGMLNFDSQGNLVDMQGNFVLGVNGDPSGRDASSERIRVSLPNVLPTAGSVTQSINGKEISITASNTTTDGNISFNFTTDQSLADGVMEAVLSTSGIIIKMNPQNTYSSLAEFQNAVNAAIVKANDNKEHAGGTYSFNIAGANPFAEGPLTATEITSTNYGIVSGSFSLNGQSMFGGMTTTGKVGTTFSAVGDMTDAEKFDCVYKGTSPNAYWEVTAVIAGQTYTGVIEENRTAAGKFMLKNTTTNDENDYFEMSRPSFNTICDEWTRLHGNPGVPGVFEVNPPAAPIAGTGNVTVNVNGMACTVTGDASGGTVASQMQELATAINMNSSAPFTANWNGNKLVLKHKNVTAEGATKIEPNITGGWVPAPGDIDETTLTINQNVPDSASGDHWPPMTGLDLGNPTATASAPSRALGFSGMAFTLTGGTEGGPQTIADVTGISIAPNGILTGFDSQGVAFTIGRIDIATFANPSGLQQSGSSNFIVSANSGLPQLTQPGMNGSGKLVSGTLELSNVDLSREFSDMITTQRGYQANSRIITVSDTMLEELINLKR